MSIEFKNVSYIYSDNTSSAVQKALDNISFTIEDGSFTTLIGHTGSGKSTLIQHLNGLLKPTKGIVRIDNQIINNKTKSKELNRLCKKVGVLFQFSEYQLFEETVLKDIAFAPKNFGKSDADSVEIAKNKAQLVGLSLSDLYKSPFEFSGGQMRLIALAGILAMDPNILVLDEPFTGLDPLSKKNIMDIFNKLNKNYHITIVLVTHNMDDVAYYSDHVIVLENGKLIADDTPLNIFQNKKWIYKHHLGLPKASEFYELLLDHGMKLDHFPLRIEDLSDQLASKLLLGESNR